MMLCLLFDLNHTGRGGQPQAHSQFNSICSLSLGQVGVSKIFFTTEATRCMHESFLEPLSSSSKWEICWRKTLDGRIHPYLLLLASKRGGRHAHSLALTGYSHAHNFHPPNPYYLSVYHQSLSLLWLANWRLWIMIAHSVKTTSFSSNWNAMHVLRHISVKISVAKKDSPELL